MYYSSLARVIGSYPCEILYETLTMYYSWIVKFLLSNQGSDRMLVACYMRWLPWLDNKNLTIEYGQPTENITKKLCITLHGHQFLSLWSHKQRFSTNQAVNRLLLAPQYMKNEKVTKLWTTDKCSVLRLEWLRLGGQSSWRPITSRCNVIKVTWLLR